VSAEQFKSCSKVLTGRELGPLFATRIIKHADASRFQHLVREACRLADAASKLIEHSEVVRALEQEVLHAIINCLTADETSDRPRRRHTAVMARFEASLSKRFDRKLKMTALCADIGVPERSLRQYCDKFLGVSPMRYALLRRLNRARSALRRADPSMATVAEVARSHQFLELGRFAVMYRKIFGESPFTTLHHGPQAQLAEST
jgi:transcriptional regulator GlxA family with amidase domain